MFFFLDNMWESYFQLGGGILLLLGALVKSKFDGLKSQKYLENIFLWIGGGILLLLATRKKQLPQEERMFENSEASVNAEPTLLRKRIKSNKLQF